jgi:hypothetical protein
MVINQEDEPISAWNLETNFNVELLSPNYKIGNQGLAT